MFGLPCSLSFQVREIKGMSHGAYTAVGSPLCYVTRWYTESSTPAGKTGADQRKRTLQYILFSSPSKSHLFYWGFKCAFKGSYIWDAFMEYYMLDV